ncbi:unnamed protein product, partial [Iphiclides podalirius]
MPPADVLASQRAREVECERELKLLRESHSSEESGMQDVRFMRSDSSGSDGESSLAAAVDSLRVQHDSHPSPTTSVTLIEFISQLLQHLPENGSQFLKDYLQVLHQGNQTTIKIVTCEMLEGIEAAVLNNQNVWDGPSIMCCSAWLCTVSVVGGNGLGLRLRRALHALLQYATDEQVEALGRIMSETLCTPELLLELSDAVQGPLGAPRNLATHLVQLALDKEECFSVRLRYTLVQLTGRAAAAGLKRRWAPALLQLPHSAPRTDRLKMAVAASKLQLLFHDKN